MNVFIITGASRGIGDQLCQQLLNSNNLIIALARSENERLEKLAREKECKLIYYKQDLANTAELEGLMEKIIKEVGDDVSSISLINNAGVIEPIGRAENNPIDEVALNIAINLTAPMILSATFIKLLENKNITKRIINISSGAGRKVYKGWSSYCTAKAGLDHFSRVIATEQEEAEYGVEIISLAPGIIDTEMQATIRSSNKSEFPHLEQFINYKNKNLLTSPEETARKIIRILSRDDFSSLETIADLRLL